jgi:hypothetical protein
MRYIALIIFAVMSVAPVSAQYTTLRPRGAVPTLDGCNQNSGYPDCHPDRPYMYQGRSVASWGYPHYGYGYNCLYYGYANNCPYYELPNWNGPMEIRNPGGG